jgi:hypothetical protein
MAVTWATCGCPTVSVPVLSNTAYPPRKRFQRSAVADDDPAPGGAVDPQLRHGRRQDQRTRRRHNQHGEHRDAS